jgi:hypothetical protein
MQKRKDSQSRNVYLTPFAALREISHYVKPIFNF